MDVPIKCACPPKGGSVRHPEGDTVVLRDKLGSVAAMTVRNTVRLLRMEGANVAQALAGITECYLLVGIESWTLRDASDNPIPVSNQTIAEHLMTHLDQTMTVADEADGLYQEAVMAPLVQRDYGFTPPTPTPSEDDDFSTSPSLSTNPEPSPTPLKPSKPSSITTTQTVATETTSVSSVGGSSSSQKTQSAA